MSTPQTTIYICSGVPLNSRYDHSLTFLRESDQLEYFRGKAVKTLTAYSFIRRSWTLKVQAVMSEALKWNYLFFRNTSGDPSYMYYFINKVEYVNDSTVELALELDVLQTYYWRYDLLPCFIERQHTATDRIGEYTEEEGLDVGALTNQGCVDVTELKELCLLTMSSYNLLLAPVNLNNVEDETPYWTHFTLTHGVYSQPQIYYADVMSSYATGGKDVSNVLSLMEKYGYLDAIVTMWMYPKNLVAFYEEENHQTPFRSCTGVRKTITKDIPLNTNLDGYTPRNNKLYCYPYNFLYGSNNNGSGAIYRYERSGNPGKITFKITGSITPDGGVKCIPDAYNGVSGRGGHNSPDMTDTHYGEGNHDEALTLSGFPTCAWDADPYKIWLAQNQNQQALAMGSSGVKIASGMIAAGASLATGNILGAGAGVATAYSGAMGVASILAQRDDMDIQPPQARGSLSANTNIAAGRHTFTFYYRTVTAEKARIIDDFFTMFGYRLNIVAKPNIYARARFTYVKTRGCHATGNLNNEDIQKIESIFDKGVTFWADVDGVGDYEGFNQPTEQD